MAFDLSQERQQAHAYLDRLPAVQLSAVRSLLESMADPLSASLASAPLEDEEISEEEAQAVERLKTISSVTKALRSRMWSRNWVFHG